MTNGSTRDSARFSMYAIFSRNLVAACRLIGATGIENNDRKLQSGIEKAIESARSKGIGILPDGSGKLSPQKFREYCYCRSVLNPSTSQQRMLKIDFEDRKHAEAYLLFNRIPPEKITDYMKVAQDFLRAMNDADDS